MFQTDCNNPGVKDNVAGYVSMGNHVMQTRPVPIIRRQKPAGRTMFSWDNSN